MTIRAVESRDANVWAAMRGRLWPEADAAELMQQVLAFTRGTPPPMLAVALVAEDGSALLGFVELALRAFADGCDSMPVPHVEGWYVEPAARGRGVGRLLLGGVEEWARGRGYREIASDTEVHNAAAQRAHRACGYHEVDRLVKFRKPLV